MAAKHAKIIFFLIFLAAFFGAAAYFTFFKKPDLFEVKSGDITEDIKAQGSIIAANDIKLGFNDSGRVGFVNVKPGSAVEEGELIASLDSNELSAELKKYEAEVELAG
ncbi:biotin/lipoyl-binding protein, partial [Candidatus Azambacteria bacterium]|nr:biotin/lipoyl-binding protein [Candidatus Azambacteria bacterium]